MDKNGTFTRMICAVKPKISEVYKDSGDIYKNLMQVPNNSFAESCLSVEELQEIEKVNNKKGVSKSLIPDNCKYIVGNVLKEKNNVYAPMCITYVSDGISQNFTDIAQCEKLETASPIEFKKKWISLGCPYHVNAENIRNLGLKNADEVLPFKEIKFPEYDALVNKHIGVLNAPFTSKEFKKVMKK